MVIDKKLAFSIGECIIVLLLLGLLYLLTMVGMNKIFPDKEQLRFRKAYYTVSRTVSEMINDDVLYPSATRGFAYLENVPIANIDNVGDVSKLRQAFRYKANIKQFELHCATIDNTNGSRGICFLLDNGAVVGIPSVSFGSPNQHNFGISRPENLLDENGGTAGARIYVPFYVYTSTKDMADIQNAYIIGVTQHGALRLLPNTHNNKKLAQAQAYLKSASVTEKYRPPEEDKK